MGNWIQHLFQENGFQLARENGWRARTQVHQLQAALWDRTRQRQPLSFMELRWQGRGAALYEWPQFAAQVFNPGDLSR